MFHRGARPSLTPFTMDLNSLVDLTIKWFSDIEELATDRKTLTGAVMDKQHCLDEIASMASTYKQYVEEFYGYQ